MHLTIPSSLTPSRRTPRPLLAHGFDPRRNNLPVLRLVLAGLVLVVHTCALSIGRQPRLGRADVGEIAVDGFFVVSGFLVAGSAARLPSVRRFLWHRAVRLLPGFWVCLVVTAFVVAPLLALLSGQSVAGLFGGDGSAMGYVVRNAGLLIRQWGIGGLRADGYLPEVLNGSLWSLYYEGLCYLALGGLAAVGLIGTGRVLGLSRRAVVAAGTVALWLTLLAGEVGLTLPADMARRMLFVFLLGVLAQLYADRIRLDGRIAAVAGLVWLGSCLAMRHYELVGGVAFAYALLWVAVAAPVTPQPRSDLSYGVYLYHWPVLAVLLELGLADAGPIVLGVVAVPLTALLAAMSWRFVEAPAQRLRSVGSGRRTAPRGAHRLVSSSAGRPAN